MTSISLVRGPALLIIAGIISFIASAGFAEDKEISSKPDSRETVLKNLQERIKADEAGDVKNKTNTKRQENPKELGAGPKFQASPINTYRVYVSRLVEKNWNFSKQSGGKMDHLMVEVMFRVMPDGKIQDIVFAKRSGDRHVDSAAYDAILKTNPAPPFPKDLQEKDGIMIGLRFTPEGMR